MVNVQHPKRWWWAAVGAIVLAGFALRLFAARGGLWTDEAWSMVYAMRAHDPAGVFLRINHDNNHHLNSLWLQAIGPAASPLLARLPSVVGGTLSIVVAAILGARRSRAAGLVAAALFAVTPILVVFSSEARGYATMLLAALLMLLVVSDAAVGRPVRGAPGWLGAIAAFGMVSHITMAAPVAIVTLWFYLERRSAVGPDKALLQTLRLMGPALFATAAFVVFVAAAAAMSATGMQTAAYLPFALGDYLTALDDLGLWSVGLSAPVSWIVPLLIGAGAALMWVRQPEWLGPRGRLYALLVLVVPVGILVIRAGNSGFARFYLASGIGLLLFVSDWIARGLEARPATRAAAAALLVALVGVGLYRDAVAISLDRGKPDAALADMAALQPAGARIAFAGPRLKAVVAVAAERTGYAARFAGGCMPADFLLAAQSRGVATRSTVVHCGKPMEAIDSSVTIPLTGDSWVLYRAKPLQSFGAADSGPPPGARNRRLSGRAGVAQG